MPSGIGKEIIMQKPGRSRPSKFIGKGASSLVTWLCVMVREIRFAPFPNHHAKKAKELLGYEDE
jgi:hypothetical protein